MTDPDPINPGSSGGGGEGGCDPSDCGSGEDEAVCGDGVIGPGERCDDGNPRPGDGCSGQCRLEPNYECPEPGEECVSTVECGDGEITGGEPCDDGNDESGDGCSDECEVEDGFACSVAGEPCTEVDSAECGDGAVNFGETCDDGNQVSDDGCDEECIREDGYTCPVPGELCILEQYCGDGELDDDEDCDDGNPTPGDGCTGICTLEPFYDCPEPGEPCVSTIVCGDEKVVGDEACDDGNEEDGDGCAGDCKAVEPGYTCPTSGGIGGECTEADEPICGDSVLSFGEFCDDGNINPDDGCDNCEVTPGYTCPEAGRLCQLITWCGDGILTPSDGEQCDDGEDPPVGGDGCTALCLIETNYTCPAPGQPCISTVVCGDKKVNGMETCDDGNNVAGDGCTACQQDDGWVCPVGGVCRAAECGDGIVAGIGGRREQCDDGNDQDDDGCSSDCHLEPGFACDDSSPSQCHGTECGDGNPEGLEQCDDGNTRPFDGCADCQKEPTCNNGAACEAVCGDGIKFPDEDCDDGNIANGDGCSWPDCELEPGYECVISDEAPNPLALTLILRDFKAGAPYTTYSDTGISTGHTDFEWSGGRWEPVGSGQYRDSDANLGNNSGLANVYQQGLTVLGLTYGFVAEDLASDKRPAFAFTDPDGGGDCPLATGALRRNSQGYCVRSVQNATSFDRWFHDVDAYNNTYYRELLLTRTAGDTYVYDSEVTRADGTAYPAGNGYKGFWPLDDVSGVHKYSQCSIGGQGTAPTHNFHFTSEVRRWFQFDASDPPTLIFTGDDDVFVFIKGKRVLDLGGIHDRQQGTVTLNAAGNAFMDLPPSGTDQNIALELENGKIYEVIVFQAERNTCESNYRLELQNFNLERSECEPVCGDGVVTLDEACDDGTNDGSYGTCKDDCSLAPFCGDATVQSSAGEECDNGVNLDTYRTSGTACAPGCLLPPECGDGNVDSPYEACDEGSGNGSGYGHCASNCQLGPRCGDHVITDAEECDDGTGLSGNGTPNSKCTTSCTLKCGNGVVDAGEQCDNGKAQNKGGYGGCTSTCRWGPRCGDGVRQANKGEECDDGNNTGGYGRCAAGCVLGPYCGDGLRQSSGGELCDDGDDNEPPSSAYGEEVCTTLCRPAPYCGDRAVDTSQGETCDDGVNDGSPGHCKTNCKGWVPNPSCGNGTINAGEECDEGSNNGKAGYDCDTHCRRPCGNGTLDAGEDCDNGVNNGSYGTCTPDCEVAGYCGDGHRDSPFEACDNGDDNEDGEYGAGICTTGCQRAPYCGDRLIQPEFDEECDGGSGCNSSCKYNIPK